MAARKVAGAADGWALTIEAGATDDGNGLIAGSAGDGSQRVHGVYSDDAVSVRFYGLSPTASKRLVKQVIEGIAAGLPPVKTRAEDSSG